MEELAQVVEQVKILSDTITAMLQRQEQVFKLHEEKLTALEATMTASSLVLSAAAEEIQTTNQALLESLNDADSITDDLAKVTEALLLIKKDMKQDMQGSEPSDASLPTTL